VGDMLGKVLGQDYNEFIKSVEIGDLSMRTDHETIDYIDYAHIRKPSDSTPERSFATAWLSCDLGFFRVDLSVISPQSQKSNDYFSLSGGKSQNIVKTVSDIVKLLKEQLR